VLCRGDEPVNSLSVKGALNPNFLNFTKNREKFCH